MYAETGQLALAFALALAVVQSILPLAGAATGRVAWMRSARYSAWGQFAFLLLAFACLTAAFIQHDFSIAYVANHSNSILPLQYRITAVWGGHEGSLLLWVLILAAWGVAVAIFSRNLPEAMLSRVLAVLGLVGVGFISFMVFTSNPFDRMIPVPLEGRDLNPMLQDPGMIFHPPLLYMGYVGFAVSFAFAMAALLSGRLDAAWARWSRPWTVVAWSFLTLGIALGGWWAYYELGWGGWWFWDPVENASFMPWLTGTALLHSLAVTEKRGALRSWTVLLAILTFALTLLGAFLVRSGVITSVHAFATDPDRGVFILVFLAVSVGASLSIYAWRAPRIGMGGRFAPVSREGILLVNNLLLVVAMAAVLLGTIYPLVIDALGMGKISVGPPYFDAVFAPIMLPLMALLAFGPLLRWKQDRPRRLYSQLGLPLALALGLALLWSLLAPHWSPLVTLSLFIALGIALVIAMDVSQRIRQAAGSVRKWLRPAWLGMHVAHFGLAVFIVGVAMVMAYETERDVRMALGQQVSVGGYEFRFDGVERIEGANYLSDYGSVLVWRDGRELTTLHPEKRYYHSQPDNPMTQASLDRGIWRDLYVSLGEPLDQEAWVLRVYHKPYMNWIWLGTLLMAMGGLLAVADRRYRVGTGRNRREAVI